MRRVALLPVLVLSLCACVALVGCDDEDDTDSPTGPATYSIVGSWETDFPSSSPEPLVYWTFNSDGSCATGETYPPSEMTGTYTVTGDTLVTILESVVHIIDIFTITFRDADNVLLRGLDNPQVDTIPLVRYGM